LAKTTGGVDLMVSGVIS